METYPILLCEDGLYRKKCAVCDNFIAHKYASQIKQRTCSHSCKMMGNKRRVGHKPANAFKKGETAGKNNVNYKEVVKYGTVHDWMRYNFGTPKECEHCDFVSDNTYQFNWANISGEYKREREDWLRLCRKCHHKYDDISSKIWAKRAR